MPEGFIPPHGGYESLLSYQRALVVYDATVYFCGRFFNKRDRTCDQMIQAARSGKQNIVEGSQISGPSKESEIKPTNVARGSLEELLEDYRDFLRLRRIEEWPRNHKYVKRLQSLTRQPGANYETFRKGIEHPDLAICANVIIGLIKVTSYLIDQQIRKLEIAFLEQGGLREAMTRARLAIRSRPTVSPRPSHRPLRDFSDPRRTEPKKRDHPLAPKHPQKSPPKARLPALQHPPPNA